MSHFYGRVCVKGHYEIDYRRAKPGNKCKVCGRQLIDTCPDCGELISHIYRYGQSPILPKEEEMPRPDKCDWCGYAYPWSGNQERGPAKREWANERMTKVPVYVTLEEALEEDALKEE